MINEPTEDDIVRSRSASLLDIMSSERPRSVSIDPRSPIDPYFGRLIALPSVKLTKDFEKDLEQRNLLQGARTLDF